MCLQRAAVFALLVASGAVSWTIAAPGVATPRLVPWSIAFWNARDGLIGAGAACSRPSCPGTISVTHDGGRTSRVVLRTHAAVEWVTVAAGGHAWATAGPALLRS